MCSTVYRPCRTEVDMWILFVSWFKIQASRFKYIYSSKLHDFNTDWYTGIGSEQLSNYPCLLLITVDMEILIKAWGRCHKDRHKWKRSDSPCNTGCITVFRTRFKHMWPRAVHKVDRVINIAYSWALMSMKSITILQSINSVWRWKKLAYITYDFGNSEECGHGSGWSIVLYGI